MCKQQCVTVNNGWYAWVVYVKLQVTTLSLMFTIAMIDRNSFVVYLSYLVHPLSLRRLCICCLLKFGCKTLMFRCWLRICNIARLKLPLYTKLKTYLT